VCVRAGVGRTEMAVQRQHSLPKHTGRWRRLLALDPHDSHQLWRVQVSAVDSLLLRGRRRRRGVELQRRRLSGDAADRLLCRLTRSWVQLRVRGDRHHVQLRKHGRWRLSLALQRKDDAGLPGQLARRGCRLLDVPVRNRLFLPRRERHGRALYLRERRERSDLALRKRLSNRAPRKG